jgi:hypothetical protein
MVLSTALFDRAPFRNCVCHRVVLDEDNQKLSKRLKNYPDPVEVFDQYGADALRWYMMSSPLMVGGDLVIPKGWQGHRQGDPARHSAPVIIRDTVLQRVIMNSLSDGALRLYAGEDKLLLKQGIDLMSEFYHAVKHVFATDWVEHTPKTSRLVHGAGIIALGYVMDYLNSVTGATTRDDFTGGLRLLAGKTAWSEGEWEFGTERRRWDGLQNVPTDSPSRTMRIFSSAEKCRRVARRMSLIPSSAGCFSSPDF